MTQPDGATTTINDANSADRAIEAMVTAQAIGVAARLGLADHLVWGPRTGEDLVRVMGAHPEMGQRFLQVCVAAGLLSMEQPGEYALTPLGKSLRSNGESFRNLAIAYTSPVFWLPMERLMETVMTGRPAAESALGMKAWDYYESHPEEEAHLAAGMSENTALAIADIVRHYDFSGFTRIVDIGGSRGDLLCAMLAAAPAASGVIFDRPETARYAVDTIARHSLTERVEVVSGSFFEDVPHDGDLYVVKTVICDWDDVHAMQILGNCRRAGTPGARLLVADPILPSDPSSPRHFLDLVCRTVFGGRERTVTEMKNLIAASGYHAARVVVTTDVITLVEAEATGDPAGPPGGL